MRIPTPAAALCLVMLSLAPQARAEKRVALVIGNGAYRFNTTLRSPPNDAADVAEALRASGFAATTLVDAGREAMERSIRDFGSALKDPEAVGLFYYSGHGAQCEGQNFLLPVDSDIQDADELRYKAVDAESVLAKMRSAGNRLNIVVLDACRNNPFPGSTKSAERGLAIVKVKVPESLIVYATDPGSVAADGEGRNSPFTRAFIDQMGVPGQDVAVMMKRVTAAVRAATKGAQSPWTSSNLSVDFAFRAVSSAAAPAPSGAPASALRPSSADGFGPMADRAPIQVERPAREPILVPKPASSPIVIPRPAPAPVIASRPAPPKQPKMVEVPGGAFVMGSSRMSPYIVNETRMAVSGFLLQATEVTVADWRAYLSAAGLGFDWSAITGLGSVAESQPITGVSWFEAVAYCNWMSRSTGLPEVYAIDGASVAADFSKGGYRLPTETEWEYAARGAANGRAFDYAGGQEPGGVAWYAANSGGRLQPVATKAANELGLFDMSGNAAEWVWDWFNFDLPPSKDYRGPGSGPARQRILKGGSFLVQATYDGTLFLRPYAHGPREHPEDRFVDVGFRMARSR